MKKRIVRQKAKGPVDPTIGLRIRQYREARNMTQAALAQPEFSKGFISLLETGRTRISVRALGVIARKLGVPDVVLIGQEGAAQSELPSVGDLLSKALDLMRECEDIAQEMRERRDRVRAALEAYTAWERSGRTAAQAFREIGTGTAGVGTATPSRRGRREAGGGGKT